MTTCSKTDDVKEDDEEELFADYTRGVWIDNVYTNEFVGLSFTMPEGWK